MKRRYLALAALLVALSLVAAACGGKEKPAGKTFSIKVGALLPLTGFLSDFGPAMSKGAQLAKDYFVEQARKANVTVKVELLQQDDFGANNNNEAISSAKQLQTDGVSFMLGGTASSTTLAVANAVTIPGKIPLITASATSGDISKLADDDFVWRIPPSDEFQAPILAKHVFAAFGKDAVLATGGRNDSYGKYITQEFIKAYSALGGKTKAPVFWKDSGGPYDSEAAKLVSGNPAGWVLIDFPAQWKEMTAALLRTGKWDPKKTWGADGVKTSVLAQEPPKGAGKAAMEGMRGTGPGALTAFEAFWNARAADTGRGEYDAQAFDAITVGLLAALKANSTDGSAIRSQIREVAGPGGTKYDFEHLSDAIKAVSSGQDIDYEGASGPIDFDAKGDPASIGALYDVWVFKDAKLTVETVEAVKP
jgi:branched-chain amino acid transport system substrate-binding protein